MLRTHSRDLATSVLVACLASACGTSAPASPPAATHSEVLPITLDGTRLRVRKPDGTLATNGELVGASLVVSVDGGAPQAVRIDAIEPDPSDETGEVLLYTFSRQDPATGTWSNVCPPDPSGLQRGFLFEGWFTASGEHRRAPGELQLACTSDAIGKCVRLGYHPWRSDELFAQHQACTRMLRADYCGDGSSHTRQGTLIDGYDKVGIQRDEPAPGMELEAGWGVDGATCVRRTRIPEDLSLDELRARCPHKLAGRSGEACTEDWVAASTETLLINKSMPRPPQTSSLQPRP